MTHNIEILSTEQAKWLYEIRDDANFYQSIDRNDQVMVQTILQQRKYYHSERVYLEDIRQKWIRYVKLNNHKTI